MLVRSPQRLLAVVALLIAAVAVVPPGAPGSATAAAAILHLPPEINAVVSLNVGEVWTNDALSPIHEARGKLEFAWAVQSLVGVTPEQIDRLTLFWSAAAPRTPFVLIKARKPLDAAAVAKTLTRPGGNEPKPMAGKVLTAPGADFAYLFPVDDRSVVLAHKSADPELVEDFAGIIPRMPIPGGNDSTLAVSLDGKALPRLPLPNKGLGEVQSLMLTARLGKTNATVKLTATFAADAAARKTMPMLRMSLRELSGWAEAQEKKAEDRVGPRNSYTAPLFELLATTLKAAKVRTEENTVVATAELKLDDFASAVVMAAPDAVLADGGSTIAENNVKQIAIAFHAYNDANAACVSNSYDKDGKPLLSWRVHLLPYIEQGPLYNRFKLDEPWDSPHNKPLGETVVKVFQVPGHPTPKPWMTYLRGFIGPKDVKPEHQPWLLEGRTKGPQFPANFPDGTSNTLLVAEAAEAVPWSKPDDLVYDGVMPLPKLGGPNGSFVVGFADGSTRTFRRGQLNEMTLRALITTSGGEVVSIPGR
jgi:hypothetical protein